MFESNELFDFFSDSFLSTESFQAGDLQSDRLPVRFDTASKYLPVVEFNFNNDSQSSSKQAALKATNLEEMYNKYQPQLDSNRDGRIDLDELNVAFQKSFEPEAAQLIVALKRHYEDLSKQNDTDGNGISSSDVKIFHQQASIFSNMQSMAFALQGESGVKFEDFDKNADSRITLDEVDMRVQGMSGRSNGSDLNGEKDFAMFLKMFLGASRLIDGKDEGLTKRELQTIMVEAYNDSTYGLASRVDDTLTKVVADTRTPSALYSNADNPLASIVPEAVRQRNLGDCYLLAAIASVASTNPQRIKDMIQDNGDGSYKVRFSDDMTITVSLSDQEIASYAQPTEHGRWPLVLEKAFGALRVEARKTFLDKLMDAVIGSKPVVPSEGADGGGDSGHALALLNGTPTDSVLLSKFTDGSRQLEELHELLSQSPASTAAIFKWDDRSDHAGLADTHAYSVLRYDDVARTIILRDPTAVVERRDKTDGTVDGVTVMSLQEFARLFSELYYVPKKRVNQ